MMLYRQIIAIQNLPAELKDNAQLPRKANGCELAMANHASRNGLAYSTLL